MELTSISITYRIFTLKMLLFYAAHLAKQLHTSPVDWDRAIVPLDDAEWVVSPRFVIVTQTNALVIHWFNTTFYLEVSNNLGAGC